jgi:hypothetical protein
MGRKREYIIMSFKKNTEIVGFPFHLVSATDGSDITGGAGSVTVYYILDGATQTSLGTGAVHEGNGEWSITLTAAAMNGDIVGITCTHASAITAHFTIKTDTVLVSELNDFDWTTNDVAVVTTVTNAVVLPTIPTDWITATGIATSALDDKGNWNVGKTGYSIDALPAISAGWLTAAGIDTGALDGKGDWNINKTGYSITSLPAITTDWITATGIAASALDGKGDWNTGKTGYSIDALPAISAGWLTAAGIDTNALDGKGDWNIGKTGYTLVVDPLTAAEVKAEVVAVMDGDSYTLPGKEAPPVSPTFSEAVMWLYKFLRNEKRATNTLITLYNDDGTIVDAQRTIADDGTTYTEDEVIIGA